MWNIEKCFNSIKNFSTIRRSWKIWQKNWCSKMCLKITFWSIDLFLPEFPPMSFGVEILQATKTFDNVSHKKDWNFLIVYIFFSFYYTTELTWSRDQNNRVQIICCCKRVSYFPFRLTGVAQIVTFLALKQPIIVQSIDLVLVIAFFLIYFTSSSNVRLMGEDVTVDYEGVCGDFVNLEMLCRQSISEVLIGIVCVGGGFKF